MRLASKHWVGSATAMLLVAACGSEAPEPAENDGVSASALTAQDRLNACAQDPRVVAGLISARICAGGDIFARETFSGNGRTCTTCHPIGHNTTIDVPFIASLPSTDPLFVFETNPNLAGLETLGLRAAGNVLENVDGFEDPTHKYVLRSVPHTLSLKTTIAADTADLHTTKPPVERTGWGGDGAPDDGSLRAFLNGAIKQHYTKSLARIAGTDFRVATSLELDLVNEFQQALGRTNELNLQQVNLSDAVANQGKQVFLDPLKGRCNVCHSNAGANFIDTGKNRNFDIEIRDVVPTGPVGSFPDGSPLFDGGFGGIGLTAPTINGISADPTIGPKNAFGNGTFNTPPLIEAIDTPPFFHNNAFIAGTEIEGAVFFYIDPGGFAISEAAKEMNARFGSPINFTADEGNAIGRFLRSLNTAFNLDIAKQRLNGALTLFNRFRDTRADLQISLLKLADTELNDAFTVLSHAPAQPFYPVSVDRIGMARTEIAAAITAPASSRGGHISNAMSRVQNARDPIGSNINFTMGQGNLMF
jgi:hypothetical protein